MNRVSRWRTSAAIAIVPLAVGLSGCGGSSSSPSAASATSGAAAATSAAGGSTTPAAATSGSPAAISTSAAATAAATGGAKPDHSKLTIAAVYGGTTDPFWSSLGCGAKQEAATLGVKFKEFSSTTLDTAAFSQNFSSAQLINPSGFLVNPSNPNQFISQYKTLMAKGVPIVTINSSTPPSQYQVVGTDVKNLGFLSALTALVPTGSGSLAVVDGIPGLVPVENRLQPVVSAVKTANASLKALPTIYSGFDTTKATSAVSSLLIAHPDLKIIVAADGPDGQAAAAAVQQAGKAGKVKVVALDATPAEVTALKTGTITALVAQSPQQIGAGQVKALVDYLDGGHSGAVTASATGTGVPQQLLTKDNVDSASNSGYLYKSGC